MHVDTWRTTYRGVIPDDLLARLTYERREQGWNDVLAHTAARRLSVFVAESSYGQVVGFVSAGPENSGDPDYQAEIYAIYVLEADQRHGVGRRLMHAAAGALTGSGFASVLLWVLTDNHGARAFYEALGGRLLRERPIDVLGVSLTEVAYGWDAISRLIAASAAG